MHIRRISCLLSAGLLLVLGACGNVDPQGKEDGGPDAAMVSGQPASIGMGDYKVAISADARTITLGRRDAVLLTFAADGFQIGTVGALDGRSAYDPYAWEAEDGVSKPPPPDDLTWRNVTSAQTTSSTGSVLVITMNFEGGTVGQLTVEAAATGRFTAMLVPTKVMDGQAIAFFRLRPRASSTEAFYGLGEWGDDVNHRGHLRPMQMELDTRYENSDDENHVPVPLLIGTHGWGLFVESRRVGAFDVARKADDLVEITFGTAEESAKGLRFHLFAAEHPLDITKLYYDVTSYPRLPAEWALGPWIWRDENRDQAQLIDDINKIRDLDLPTSGIWIDRPYATAVESFDFLKTQFTDPQTAIDFAHSMGLKIGLWHAPYLEKSAGPYFDEATAKSYFPPKYGLLLNKWGVPIDFTNKEAYAWWQTQLRKYTSMGIEGFKLDYAEDIVPGAFGHRNVWQFADGSDERTMHYGYTLLHHQAYQEVLPQTGSWLMCRAGRWGDQKNVSLIWPGDLDATFTKKGEAFTINGSKYSGVGGFPASVADGLSLGPSGFPFFAADTGGYIHSPPNKELFVRWAEQTSLSTVMHVGDSSSQTPWEFTADNGRDQQALDIYRGYARLHMRLFPYEWTYAKNLARDGRPIARALGLAYPELGVHPSDTYLFGDNLLVAPVVTAGQTSREVNLPPGDWIDWWDGTTYSGGSNGLKVTIPAPLEKLPLLLRAGSIVPLLRPTIDSTSPTTAPDRCDSFATTAGILWVRIEPSQKSTFTVYDGTVIGAGPDGKIDFTGGSDYHFGAMFEVVRTTMPPSVKLDGSVLSAQVSRAALEMANQGWFWEAALGGTLWVKLPGGQHSVTTK